MKLQPKILLILMWSILDKKILRYYSFLVLKLFSLKTNLCLKCLGDDLKRCYDLQLSVDKCSENQSQMPDALVHTLTVSD